MLTKDKHEHTFKPVKKHVLLHSYRSEGGVYVAVDMSGKDILRVWVCECGASQTSDIIERVKI